LEKTFAVLYVATEPVTQIGHSQHYQ